MDYLDTRWTKLRDYDFGDHDNVESEAKKFINSDEESGDEEWVQQLQRDYGRSTTRMRIGKRWTNWSGIEKILVICLVVSVSIGIVLASILIIQNLSNWQRSGLVLKNGWTKDEEKCLNRKCVEASFRIDKYLDESKDPCEDFYQFSCGKWLENVEIPSGSSKRTSFTEKAEENHLKLRNILERLHPLKNDSEAIVKARMYYKACRDYDWMEQNGKNSLKMLIKAIGSWGMWNATEWNDEDWSFEQALTKTHKLKSMPLFYMFVAADDLKADENTIQVR